MKRANWTRCRKWCVILASGGVTPGILQGLEMVNFASIITSALASFFSLWVTALVTLLMGGDASTLFA